jgi:lipid II isoglutaminyl synthase (glutamine-hydrolysing)
MTIHKSSIINHKSLTIGWLYPELMNTYGDRGNLITLEKRCLWRNIQVKTLYLNPGFNDEELGSCDILLMGGAQDQQQNIVNSDLTKHKKVLSQKIENGTPGLFICGGYQFLGNYYKEADGRIIDGLGIFDLYTENPGTDKPRLIGNIAIDILDTLKTFSNQSEVHNSEIIIHNSVIVGFENHGGRTYLGKNIKPFGKVLKGYGNNGNGFEGAIYKNSFGTYLHGPILPKNPEIADLLISLALGIDSLDQLDDTLETQAKNAVINKYERRNNPWG